MPQTSNSEINDNDFYTFIEKIDNEKYVDAKNFLQKKNYTTESCQNLTRTIDKSKCLNWLAVFIKVDNTICKHSLKSGTDLFDTFILSTKFDPDNINAMANLIHTCLDAEDKFAGGLSGACGIIGKDFNLDKARDIVKYIPEINNLTLELLLTRFRELDNPDKIDVHVNNYKEMERIYNEYKEQNINISMFFRRHFNLLYGRALIKSYYNNKDETIFNEGIARLKKSKTDLPESIEPYPYLGKAYYEYKKDFKQSKKYYKQLLEKLGKYGDRTCSHIDGRLDCAEKKLSPNAFEVQSCN